MNITIMRAFIALHKMLLTNTELRSEIAYIKKKMDSHDKNIELIFQLPGRTVGTKSEA